ncbi:MAG: TrbC/VirB2 family protein [Alphaproteobacteria bacterium]
MNKNINIYTLFISVLLSVVFLSNPAFAESSGLFSDLIDKGSEIFMGMRDIIYVVSGFGIIGVAIGGFFGNINWKWIGAIIIGLMVIASTAAFIEYITGEEVGSITDTLK